MCTVTFVPRRRGYLLGMNRDEKLTRPLALPPSLHGVGRRQALFPTEPTGGTWIGVNDARVSFALVNWYEINEQVKGTATSRGEVVRQLLATTNTTEAKQRLADLPLRATNPFRLLGVFPEPGVIFEWRWNLSELTSHRHDWTAAPWISSGHDESGAQRDRGAVFRKALADSTAGSRGWLRRLHQSHGAECGPYSHCMHRPDAATVSYTEVEVVTTTATVLYSAGNPCSAPEQTEHRIKFVSVEERGAAEFGNRYRLRR